ncbi:rab11 family-interacting protein 1 [Lampris incognitus]|uniref:rab11 family-interacting protein 1 n=1 Tax=Lampris incognitus TaxID=2546036 RepID=UPI0024B533F4|nr:rab11 family-interacting protein 1 [Lampris incognitus]
MYLAAQSQDWFPTSVQVTALQARGLRIKGKNGTNDAYAMMQVAKDKYCTSVAEKSVAPVWREEATFDLPPSHRGDAERCTLRVHVMHRALVGPDKLLGQAAVHLLELDRVKSAGKSEWFKLLSKAGKPDKDRGEVLLDIQFMRNNMTASMFDLSAAGKPRSRLGKFKDRVRGKKKEGLSDTTSVVLPTLSQVLTDSEDERDRDGYCEGIAEKEEKKKHKLKNLFSPKSNLQRNMSQSMSVLGSLPQKNSLSSSHVSGLNAEPTEVKKKFKLKLHNHSSNSDTSSSQGLFHILGYPKQGPSPAAEQSNLCINGSHIYCEEPRPRSSTFSLPSVDHPSMEDIHKRQTFESSATSSNSFGALDQQLTSTEEEDGSKAADVKIVQEEEMVKITGMRTEERRMNIEEGEERKGHRMADEKKTVNSIGEEKGIVCEEIEKRWQKEEEKHDFKHERTGTGEEEIKGQHERARIMVNRTVEQRNKREEEEEESKWLVKEQGRQEKLERRKTEEEEMIKREVQERNRMQEERAEEERKKRKAKEEEDKRLAQEQMGLIELERGRMEDEEKVKRDEQEKIRMAQERAEEEMRERVRKEEAEQVMKEAEERERFTEEQKRLEEQEHRRVEKNERDKQKFSRMEEEKAEVQKKERERKEEEESKKLLEEQRKQEELERKGFEEEEQNKREERERIRLEEKAAEEQRNKRKQEEERIRKEEEGRERLTLEQKRQEELERRCIEEEKFRREETEKIMTEKSRAEEQKKKIEEERERLAGRQSRQEAPGSPRKLEELQIKREEEERAGKFWKEDRTERVDEEERMREEELLRGERAKKLSREEEEILKEGKLRKHIEENVEKGGMENASRFKGARKEQIGGTEYKREI